MRRVSIGSSKAAGSVEVDQERDQGSSRYRTVLYVAQLSSQVTPRCYEDMHVIDAMWDN
jgi:hypothetical protein